MLKMSRDRLAKQLGVSGRTLYRWETGETQPTLPNYLRLQEVLSALPRV